MQIKEVEMTTGLTKKAIRYYEECGLIKIAKKENGYKEYNEEDVDALLLIKKYRLLDFSVEDIHKYMNNEDCREVIGEKLAKNEEKILQAHQVKQILDRMLNGEKIKDMDVEKKLLEEKKKGYIYIKNNNLLFGIMNLIVFICVYTVVFMNHIKFSYSMIYIIVIQCAFVPILLSISEKRKKRANSMEILLLERKPMEVFVQLVVSSFADVSSAVMLSEGMNYAKMFYFEWHGNTLRVMVNILMGVLFAILGIIVLVLSFYNPNKKVSEYI